MGQVLGVIGGSGLYALDGLTAVRDVRVETPFGPTSDVMVRGRLGDIEMVFLPRHGRRHHLTPSEVPYRANIWAMKSLGVGWVLSVSAVGSLAEAIAPGHMVVIDQFIDRTQGRASTFFGSGCVAHVGFGDPVCGTLRRYLLEAACEVGGTTVHDGGTYVCMEGPAFSTRAESELYRSWGAQVIGMTNLPEAKLAREASISYATLAMATDYDCWNTDHDDVTVEQVISVLRTNAQRARHIVAAVAERVASHRGPAPMHDALATALITPADAITAEMRQRLAPIIGAYLP
jgi:5'-methylthioadenosine phosphorylase